MRSMKNTFSTTFLSVLLLLSTLLSFPAFAKKESEGVPVRVIVLDPEGQVIPTAVVRHPDEMDRHRVNSVDGSWEANVLYLPDGSELRFTTGMTLDLEISAPGYMTQVYQYQVRKRRNVVEVTLQPIEMDDSTIEEPIITFKQDRPRETLVDVPQGGN